MTEEQIKKQVERWDLFARIVPTTFLVLAGTFIFFDIIDFEQAFWFGLACFAFTAVSWWFWTIYTIRKLVNTLHKASSDLGEVRKEFVEIHKELEGLKNNDK